MKTDAKFAWFEGDSIIVSGFGTSDQRFDVESAVVLREQISAAIEEAKLRSIETKANYYDEEEFVEWWKNHATGGCINTTKAREAWKAARLSAIKSVGWV